MVQDIHDYTWRARSKWHEGERIVIYVEGTDDATFYERMAGPTLSQYIQFRAAPGPEGQRGGYHAWKAMKAQRAAHGGGALSATLNRAYCLLDGEEAYHAGCLDMYRYSRHLILNAARDWMPIDDEKYRTIDDLDGVLFLACYEMENLYLLHADLLRTMSMSWPERIQLFGETVEVDQAWKILQRTLVLSELTAFAKFYNVEESEFSKIIGALKRNSQRLEPLLSKALECLENCRQSGKPKERIVPRNVLRAGTSLLRQRIQKIMSEDERIKSFHPYLLTRCDGKTFRNLALPNTGNLTEYFRSQLVGNGFATYFQMSVVDALQGRGTWNRRYEPFGEGGSSDVARPDPWAGPGDEVSFGRGRFSMTARRRSWRAAPPRLPAEDDDGPR